MVFHRSRASFACLVVTSVVALGIVGCGGDDDDDAQAGAVTITTDIDFSSDPYEGTFEVSEGADELGCSSGTFVDGEAGNGVNKVATCVDGERSGTFTIFFESPADEGVKTPWRVVAATEDFSGLEGEGDFSVDTDEDNFSGVETFTGDIQYAEPE